MRCGTCHAGNPDGFRFCGSCGAPIEGAEPRRPGGDPPWVGERRHLTVMFCDLVNSTALSEQLDPEDMHRIVSQSLQLCRERIEEAGGHVAQFLGDGLLVYFGFPDAHEDDTQRAIGTGLRIVDAIQRMQPSVELPDGASIRIRVGIHAGEVVTAELGGAQRSERLALGSVPNTAARLQALAPPNSVLLSDVAGALARDGFELEVHGDHKLKGLTEPMRVYRAIRANPLRSRFESGVLGARTRLIGRDHEVLQLVERFRQCQAGRAGAVLIRGQPGIGKTRLAQAFAERIAPDTHLWLVTQCSPDTSNSVLHPLAELVRSWSGIGPEQDSKRQLATLTAALEAQTLTSEALRPIAYLLGIAQASDGDGLEGSPELQKRQVFSALVALFGALARKQPLVLIVEDLHWADPSTLELLGRMREDLADTPFLQVLTQRTGLETPQLDGMEIEPIDLGPLSDAEVHAVIDDLAGGRALPSTLDREIVARAEGVPLFAEELTKTVLTEGFPREGTGRYTIPSRLRDLFTARLDRLGTAKELAGMAAVIGHEFGVELLSAVSQLDPRTLAPRLDRLEREEILVRRRGAGTYAFKHALIRDAVNANLLRTQVRAFHEQVATALELHFPEETTRHPERLGRHWAGAGNPAKALRFFHSAAERARDVYANSEAIAFYREALEHVERVQREESPAGESFSPLRRLLREGLGDVLALTRRHTEAREAFEAALADTPAADTIVRARHLRKLGVASREDDAKSLLAFADALHELGDPPSDALAAWRQEWVQIKLELSLTHYWRARLDDMIALASEIDPFVGEFGSPQQRAELSNHLFLIHMKRGRHFPTPAALKHARSFVEAAEATGDLALLAAACATLAIVTLDAGALDAAEAHFERAHALARKTGARAVEIRCLTYGATLHRRRGDVERVRHMAEETLALAEASHMTIYVHAAHAHLAWADWRGRAPELAAARARAAVDGWQAAGVAYPWGWTALLPLLAAEFERDRLGDAVACAERLLRPEQQALPEELTAALEALVAASCAGEPASVLRDRLAATVRAAESIGYL